MARYSLPAMRQGLRHVVAASLPRAVALLTALTTVTTLTTLTCARSASAQADADRATARALGLDGSQALDSKDYPTAEDRFRRADRLVHAPTLMLGLARALAGEGKLVEATETYNRIVREGVTAGAPEPFKRALNDAKREVEEVGPKIGSVTIVVHAPGGADVANLKTVLDGAPLNSASMGVRRLVDPGAHTLKVVGDGFKTAELRFTVPEGGSINQPVTLEREPSSAPAPPVVAPGASQNKLAHPAPDGAPESAVTSGERTAGAESPEPSPAKRSALPRIAVGVAFGIGGVGLVVGAVAGVVAIGQSSALSSACSGRICPPDKQKDVDAYDTMGTLANVGFIVGGAGVAAGVVLLLAQPKVEPEGKPAAGALLRGRAARLRVTPVVGPGSIGVVGEF